MVESIEGSFASGQELAEQYVIQQPLGSSDGGEVYLAEDRATGRQVALKLFMPPVHERIRIEELQAEIEAAKTLTHKNMVQVYGLGQASGRAFVVLEYIDGQTLSERIAKRRSSGRAFSAKVVFNIIAHICSALQRVHETTVHGALTPGNVYLDQKSKVKVGNLVYGRMVATALSPEGVSLFHDSPFVAPEVQASGGRALTPAADIYALALMTMDLLSPEPLGGSAEEVLGRARVLAEKTGDGLHQLIAHATASDPAVRLANAGEFRDRLKETIAGRPRAAVQAAPERAPAPQVVAATPEVLAMSTPEVAQEEELGMALPPFVAPEPAPSQPLSLEPQPLAPDFAHEEEVALDDPFARAAAVLGKGREQSLELRLSGGEDDGDRGEARYLVSRDGLDYGPYTVQEVVDQLHKDEITENTLILDRVTQERVPMRSMRVFSKAVKEYVPIREERLRIKQEQREAVVQTAKTAGRWTAYSGVVAALLFGLGFLIYWNVFRPEPLAIPQEKLFVDLSSTYRMLPPPTEFSKVKVDDGLLAAIFNEGQDADAGGGGRGRGRGRGRGKAGTAAKKAGSPSGSGGSDENISYIDASDTSGTQKILTEQDINRTIRARFGTIAGCMRQELKRNPSFKGVTVQFFIKPSGTTGGVKIVEGRYNSTPVGNCLKGKFRAMRFPKHGGLNKGVQYPIYIR